MKIKLLDGKEIEFEKGQTGLDIAKSISTSLAKNAIAYQLDDKVYDLNQYATEGLLPDLTILVCVHPQIGLSRIKKDARRASLITALAARCN